MGLDEEHQKFMRDRGQGIQMIDKSLYKSTKYTKSGK